MHIPDASPLTDEQRRSLAGLNLQRDQLLWLSGYIAGQLTSSNGSVPVAEAAPKPVAKKTLTILYGSESGNAENLAFETKTLAAGQGLLPKVVSMADCKLDSLKDAAALLVLVSTWGEGEPPSPAEDFYQQFMSDKTPRLEGVPFAVCGLGDTSYEHFCKMGKDFDTRLEALGGKRAYDRLDCDVDFEPPFKEWIAKALPALEDALGAADVSIAVAEPVVAPVAAVEYGKKNPFPAPMKEAVILNGRGSKKETWHFEIGLEGSGLSYVPGDALAVVPTNDPEMVDGVIHAAGFTGEEAVPAADGATKPLRELLMHQYDVTGATSPFLKKYNTLTQSAEVERLLAPENKEELKNYLWGRQLIDLLESFPLKGAKPEDFTGILRKLPPRLYSIASSMRAHPDEVHLTVAAVRYDSHGRKRKGVASTFLADQVKPGDTLPVYLHHNKNFRLPESGDVPIIMVGPGTGVAPFRAFVEERAAVGATGRNWLFFGDQHFLTDFLYQLEWQDYVKRGLLPRLDLAFSRDQPHKVYVQDRMGEAAKELWAWLQDGAHFYVCGDASRMAGDVHEMLIQIAEREGGMPREDAEAWVADLKKQKRYQRDVY